MSAHRLPLSCDDSKSFYIFDADGSFFANASSLSARDRIVTAVNKHGNLTQTLGMIAERPCDHGPGFCPRIIARVALGQACAGAVLNEEKPAGVWAERDKLERSLRWALQQIAEPVNGWSQYGREYKEALELIGGAL